MRAIKELEPGVRVRVTNITDIDDVDLNGKIGVLCRKHPHIPFGAVGVLIPPEAGQTYSIRANLLHGEYEEVS